MPFDLKKVLDERKGQNFTLHSKYINPQLPQRPRDQIEFDRFYVKGEGCYLIDDKGDRYLDFLSGFGVFALGRSHPTIVRALHDALDADLPEPRADGLLASRRVSWPSSWSPGRTPASSGSSSPTPAPRRWRARSSSPGPPPSGPGSSTATTPSTA